MNGKKILIINDQSIEKRNATGITVRSILSTWDESSIYELYIDPKDHACVEAVQHNTRCIVDCYPIQKRMRKIQTRNADNNLYLKKRKGNSLKTKIRRGMINFCDCSPFILRKELLQQISVFSPDVIYTLAGSVAVMKASVAIAKKFNIPIVIHFMDDWTHYLQNNSGIEQKIYRCILKKWLRKTYRFSRINFTISPQMAREYEQEIHIKHVPLMNSVDTDALCCTNKKIGESVSLVYAGGLHLERWKPLQEIAEMLPILSKKTGRDFKLNIYTDINTLGNYKQEFDEKNVKFHDYVPHEKMKMVFEKADILIHVESTSPELLGFFRFSISTKIPEYLSSNRYFIFYGPQSIGLYSYLKDNLVAFTSDNITELYSIMIDIISDEHKAMEMKKRARIFVKDNHDIRKCQSVFKNTIDECTEK